MQLTIDMVTDLDGSPLCLCKLHEYAEQDEEPVPSTKVPQYSERSELYYDEKIGIQSQSEENESEENDSEENDSEGDESEDTKSNIGNGEALCYPLPPTEIHDGLLFRKVG
jgi:transcription elongation factor Elf1